MIACANVANLFLVRAEGQRHEVAMRSAIGAGRGRIASHFLAESVSLAALGGVVGLGLASFGIDAFVTMGSQQLPRTTEIAIEPTVLLFTTVISVVSGLFFGMFPVLRYSNSNLGTSLKEGGRGSGAGLKRQFVRNALVVSQVALTLALVAGAGLMIRSFQAMRRVDPGFERADEVLTVTITPTRAEADDGANQGATATVYWPPVVEDFWDLDIFARRTMVYAIRSRLAGEPGLLDQVRQAVWSVHSTLPLANVKTLEDIYDRSMARTSFTLVMLAIAGAVALLIGATGIYGVISYVVSQRTREIGVRMAFGARQLDVSCMVLKHGLSLTAIGVAVGLVAAVGLTRLMSTLLFGVHPVDPVTYGVVSIGLTAVALLATYLASRRAASVDPMEALRVG